MPSAIVSFYFVFALFLFFHIDIYSTYIVFISLSVKGNGNTVSIKPIDMNFHQTAILSCGQPYNRLYTNNPQTLSGFHWPTPLSCATDDRTEHERERGSMIRGVFFNTVNIKYSGA